MYLYLEIFLPGNARKRVVGRLRHGSGHSGAWVRLKCALRHAALACLVASAADAHALTPQEIYRVAERGVFVLELLDQKGEVVSFHTALVVGQGKAVTQCDLLDGAASLRLRQGEAVYPATPGRKDSARNLCLLAVPGLESAHSPALRDDDPETGAQVYALSNALGMGISIAEGVVSGIRKARGESYIQFTSAIAPGSEGGGLFDADGRLVGVINYRQRDGQNVNFALPARWLKEIEQRAASTDAAETWRAKALALERGASWQELADHADGWAKALPDSVEAWLWLGFAQEQRKDWSAAEHAYREALRREPGAIQAGTGLTTALLQQKKPQEALDAARAMLAYRQEDARVWASVGFAERALGKADEAAEALRRAAQLDPWSRDAYAGLADLARARGDWPGALAAQRQIVRIAPQDTLAWVQLADVYLRSNRPERALASAERAIELAPSDGDAWLFKGAALYALKRHSEAIATLKLGLALQPQRPAWGWAWLGDIYYGLTLYPEAIAALREAVKLGPDDVSFRSRLGIALKDGFQFEEAMGLFEKLKADYPNDPFPWRQIGFVHSYLAQPEAAIPAYEKALSLDPQQPKVWRALMEVYHMAGRREDVKRAYRKLLTVDSVWAEQAYRNLILPFGAAP
jgi:tetratricopeptide (TPR) repeat protein